MVIVFDRQKSEANRTARGLPFDVALDLDWETALVRLSKAQEVTATRFVALGVIRSVVHVLVFTLEGGDCRVLSLRRAKAKERQRWHDAQIRS